MLPLCRQWSWPLWLPVQFFGIFPDSVLVDNDSSAPWSEELEQKLFSSAVGEQCALITPAINAGICHASGVFLQPLLVYAQLAPGHTKVLGMCKHQEAGAWRTEQ